ncbi:reverse transcriptase [Gossypium australe]|uniref:Reverse transcriptase n=1 Tax=Gossypium australe TaxID=47621 RepID=A0A5B6VNP3_9ROSI|nr:reverse transcriptase [Gossypium australe]
MVRMEFSICWVDLLLHCVRSVIYPIILKGEVGLTFSPRRLGIIWSMGQKLVDVDLKYRIYYLWMTVSSLERPGLILAEYELCSGQCINFDKSSILFSSNTDESTMESMATCLGVRISTEPECYLGLPNMVGHNRKRVFQVLKDRLQSQIESWCIRPISQGGKEVFIKSVLQSIPTFSMSCFLMSSSLCSDIKNIINQFWWKSTRGRERISWCTWSKLWIGFSCFGKHPTSLLVQALKAKYYPVCDFLHALLGTYPSYLWKSIWVAKGLLHLGFGWRVGDGASIRVWDDVWILDLLGWYLHCMGVSFSVLFVLEFINSTT